MTTHGRVQAMLGQPVDLTRVDTSEPQPWTPGLPEVLRPGYRAMFFGPRGNGKSLVAMIVGLQVIEAGGSVAYLDVENGKRRQAERLATILADRSPEISGVVSERLDYRPNVRFGPLNDPQSMAEWASLFEGRDLVVIDSISRVLGQLGLKENEAADFSRFMVQYVDPVAERGAAVLLLDNTGHEEQTRARGSSAKLDLIELAYKVSGKGIAPDRHGTITLDRVRTRDGDEAERLTCDVGDGTYTRLEPDTLGERERSFVDAARGALKAGDHHAPAKGLGRDRLFEAVREAGVRGGDQRLRQLLAAVVSDPSTGVEHDPERGYFAPDRPWANGSPRVTARPPVGNTRAQPRPGQDEAPAPAEDSTWAEPLPRVTSEAPWAAGATPEGGAPPVPAPLTDAHLQQRVQDSEAMSDEDAEREWRDPEATPRTTPVGSIRGKA